MEISKDRKEVFERIAENERLGNFFEDVENDPPSKELKPKDVDYLNKRLSNKVKNIACRMAVNKMLKGYEKDHQIEYVGIENLNIDGGGVVTTNHFNYFDCAPFICAMKKVNRKRKFHILIREGNYQIGGKLGYILKNYNTFPLSQNMRTSMILNHTIDRVLKKGHLLLVYPEQAMWWNYKKPRPHKIGAYRWASRNLVPIIPCFCEMEDMDVFEDNGLPRQKLTYHILTPIYPNPNLSEKENAEIMREKNQKLLIELYEKIYKEKLGNF